MVWFMVAFGIILLFLGPFSALIFAVLLMAGSVIYRELIRLQQLEVGTVGAVGDAESQYAARFQAYLVVDLEPLRRRTIQQNDALVTCEICLEDFHEGDKVAGSPNEQCIHEFHEECISEALQRTTTCPCCRREYLHPEAPTMEEPDSSFGDTLTGEPLREEELSRQPDIESDIELNIAHDGDQSAVQPETNVEDTAHYSQESHRSLSSFQNTGEDCYPEDAAQRSQMSPLSISSFHDSHAESYTDDAGQYSNVSSISLSPFQSNQADDYIMEDTPRHARGSRGSFDSLQNNQTSS